MKTYKENHYGDYMEDEVANSLRACGATIGGGSEVLIVDVLPFDTTQVTSGKNWSHPKYGDPCHPLASQQHPPVVVIKAKVKNDLSESERNSKSRGASGKL